MRRQTYACDRCGKDASESVRVAWHDLPLRQAYDLAALDLCPDCAAELRRWLKDDSKRKEFF